MTYAFFDFDGTITTGDSFMPFLRHQLGPGKFALKMLQLSPVLAAYGLKLMANQRAKEKVLEATVKGKMEMEILRAAEEFFPQLKLLPAGLAKLKEEQAAGRRCVLVSASPELFLRTWADKLGFQQVIATRLEIANGLLTGKLVGANCYGPEKVRRIEEELGAGAWADSCGYGDSRADLPMLRRCGQGFLRRGTEFTALNNQA